MCDDLKRQEVQLKIKKLHYQRLEAITYTGLWRPQQKAVVLHGQDTTSIQNYGFRHEVPKPWSYRGVLVLLTLQHADDAIEFLIKNVSRAQE